MDTQTLPTHPHHPAQESRQLGAAGVAWPCVCDRLFADRVDGHRIVPRYDLARFGAEAMRFSPAQSDLMIVAAAFGIKIMPVPSSNLSAKMAEPKWVISMGACAAPAGVFDAYATIQGIDSIHAG